MTTLIFKSPFGKLVMAAGLVLQTGSLFSQMVYDDHEGNSLVTYTAPKAARIDTMALNPAQDEINPSAKVTKYVRSRMRYDYIKLNPKGKLINVASFTSYEESAPKFKMKIYTTAPVGTLVEIQLGKKSLTAYPDGTHSQYQARTTKTNAWEELEFTYALTPKGSKVGPDEVDQVTLLFNPNTYANGTYYFDDLTGPGVEIREASAKNSRKRTNRQ